MGRQGGPGGYNDRPPPSLNPNVFVIVATSWLVLLVGLAMCAAPVWSFGVLLLFMLASFIAMEWFKGRGL